jgi:hypothetical protein
LTEQGLSSWPVAVLDQEFAKSGVASCEIKIKMMLCVAVMRTPNSKTIFQIQIPRTEKITVLAKVQNFQLGHSPGS